MCPDNLEKVILRTKMNNRCGQLNQISTMQEDSDESYQGQVKKFLHISDDAFVRVLKIPHKKKFCWILGIWWLDYSFSGGGGGGSGYLFKIKSLLQLR